MLGRLYLVEFIKLLRGKQTWFAMILFAAVPILFAMTFQNDSPNVQVEGTFSYATFGFAMIGFLRGLLVFYFVAILFAVGNLARELEDGILKLTLVRMPNRWSVYFGKFLAVNTVLLMMLIWTVLISFVAHAIFLAGGEMSAAVGDNELTELLCAMLVTYGVIVVVVSVTFLMSMFMSFMGSLIGGLGIVIGLKLLEQWESVKSYLPFKLADAETFLSQGELTDDFTRALILLPVYVIVTFVAGLLVIEKKDIAK